MRKQIALMIILTALVSAMTVNSFAEPVMLRFAQQNPETGKSTVNCVLPWLKQVEKATNGQVKFQAFHSQSLVKGKDTWEAIKTGITDVGWCFHGYWPGLTPLSDVISLPALPFRSGEKGGEVLWKLYEKFPAIQNEYKDVKVLLFWTTEPYTLMTREKPVKTMEDLKGMKIRMSGGPPTDMMKALGGVPVMIPMPDNYVSMQKGVIDGLGVPWEAILVWRFYEVGKYYTDGVFPAGYFSISMNKGKWMSLPKDVQDAMMSVCGLEGSKYWGRNFFDAMKPATLKAIEAKGQKANIIQLSDAERARWVEVSGKPIWAKWVRDMKAKGFPQSQEILDATLAFSK